MIEKSCDNCIHKSFEMLCEKYCKNFSSHEFTCDYCIHKFAKEHKLFCECDQGDDGFSCCGDGFELNTNL